MVTEGRGTHLPRRSLLVLDASEAEGHRLARRTVREVFRRSLLLHLVDLGSSGLFVFGHRGEVDVIGAHTALAVLGALPWPEALSVSCSPEALSSSEPCASASPASPSAEECSSPSDPLFASSESVPTRSFRRAGEGLAGPTGGLHPGAAEEPSQQLAPRPSGSPPPPVRARGRRSEPRAGHALDPRRARGRRAHARSGWLDHLDSPASLRGFTWSHPREARHRRSRYAPAA